MCFCNVSGSKTVINCQLNTQDVPSLSPCPSPVRWTGLSDLSGSDCAACTCGGASLHLHVGAQRDVSRAARLQGDRVGVEVSQHVRHGVEPQVVDVALPTLVHRQAQMLRGGERERWGGGEIPRNEEETERDRRKEFSENVRYRYEALSQRRRRTQQLTLPQCVRLAGCDVMSEEDRVTQEDRKRDTTASLPEPEGERHNETGRRENATHRTAICTTAETI